MQTRELQMGTSHPHQVEPACTDKLKTSRNNAKCCMLYLSNCLSDARAYGSRLVRLLALARDASFCSGWQLLLRRITVQGAESRLMNTQLCMGCLYHPLQSPGVIREERTKRAQGDSRIDGIVEHCFPTGPAWSSQQL